MCIASGAGDVAGFLDSGISGTGALPRTGSTHAWYSLLPCAAIFVQKGVLFAGIPDVPGVNLVFPVCRYKIH